MTATNILQSRQLKETLGPPSHQTVILKTTEKFSGISGAITNFKDPTPKTTVEQSFEPLKPEVVGIVERITGSSSLQSDVTAAIDQPNTQLDLERVRLNKEHILAQALARR